MEKTESLQSNLEDGILTITFKAGSFTLTDKRLAELRSVIQDVYDDEAIEGVIITGEGEEIFSLGTEVAELLKLSELNARKFAEHGQEVLAFIENCPKPILAAINGYAFGAGFELALACHFRFASENAVFAFPEISSGVIPGFGGTQRLTQLLGKTKALEYLMTGKRMGAEDAERMGLVSEVVSYKEEMLKKAKKWLTAIVNNADLALGILVTCVNAAENPDENGFQTEANGFANCFKAADIKEQLMKIADKKVLLEMK
ncbi:enoyl-CoA hydratase/isomerase family protein [Candidatus Cardinium sp. TP]|uniref:enoyl-CoA hydratase/isomerase family protein n=1 Tax=Candidatus Cardinium sp. TP TaxID=2961955 RepID=UPI0021AF3D80|nr:enoyl-CoA hydratase/isomerase family protein [Candidatus Cardinium sp. TP]MCT4696769.1 enoyl-CoA hydratase/isomerase family protein [Candidatus Cardinium sp. TP]MDN5246775.1 enoyl-CoA hydratase/isomerase family protein [Candidatus Cardinium sp.]